MDNSHQWITYINKALFEAEERRLAEIITGIHRSNQEASAKRSDGFLYLGKPYKPKNGPRGGQYITLHLSIWPEMDAYLKDAKTIADDKQAITQLLGRLLENCFCEQDIRDAVPETIIDTLPREYQIMERRRNCDFFLKNPRDFRLYDRVLPKIQFYSAARLIY